MRKVFAEGPAEGFLKTFAQNQSFFSKSSCGRFLRKVFTEGSRGRFFEFNRVRCFCGRFLQKVPQKVPRKVPRKVPGRFPEGSPRKDKKIDFEQKNSTFVFSRFCFRGSPKNLL